MNPKGGLKKMNEHSIQPALYEAIAGRNLNADVACVYDFCSFAPGKPC